MGFVDKTPDGRYRAYFRDPGGVLFEVATAGPGFEVDETLDALGTQLKLPPWEEPKRKAIEEGLPGIST